MFRRLTAHQEIKGLAKLANPFHILGLQIGSTLLQAA